MGFIDAEDNPLKHAALSQVLGLPTLHALNPILSTHLPP